MSYQFKLDIFEGPLDLLLYLIREQKMDVYDIPISEITRQYTAYLDLMQDLNLDLAGEYLIMAAELTRIKSRLLLPSTGADEEGREEGEDPREALTRRLLEYQRYKDAALELRQMEDARARIFARSGAVNPEAVESEETVEASVFDLLTAFQSVLKDRKFPEKYELKITVVSIAGKMEELLEVLNAAGSVTFSSLFTVLSAKVEVIATFLAVLELMRLKLVRSQQTDNFEAIRIYRATDKISQDEVMRSYKEAMSSGAEGEGAPS